MRIIIIDDVRLNAEYLARLFLPSAKCDLVNNGEKALIIIKNAIQNNNNYDLICLDLVMPEMDGFEVLKHVRLLENESASQPVKSAKIMITSAVKDHNSVTKAIQLGCDGYLTKPYTRKNLNIQLENMKILA